ncbi:hypothetical protein RJT34_15397 [Clitoria ternatea]|uniref:Uncharacterized protein n=1 Tax=Clitoria ternatea TaxID=43366 RepID=A0AAN9J6R2_CLITE
MLLTSNSYNNLLHISPFYSINLIMGIPVLPYPHVVLFFQAATSVVKIEECVPAAVCMFINPNDIMKDV